MEVLEAHGVSKSYGGVVALRSCDFSVAPGTVHALLGENGAGKSTLVKILAGYVRPDTGSIALDGKPVRFANTADAARRGVAVVSQELNLFPDLDVLANLFTKREPRRGGIIDRAAMAAQAEPVLAELGLALPPRTPVGDLTLAQRQLVEIAKALLTNPRVLILDEPTSALDHGGVQRLIGVLEVLRQRQVAVVFVSHILEEVMQLSDVVTVLRDGQVVLAAADRAGLSIDGIVRAMLGDRLVAEEDAAERDRLRTGRVTPGPAAGAEALTVEGLTVRGVVEDVTLSARVGEIVGMAGLVGAGHQALLEVLAGTRRAAAGTVRLPRTPRGTAPPRTVRQAARRGIAMVSGDRKLGLMLDAPIWQNVAQVRSVALAADGYLLRRSRLRDRARARIAQLGVRVPGEREERAPASPAVANKGITGEREERAPASPAVANKGITGVDQLAGMLSGGNQQKVVLAKWLEAAPSTLLLDDPTRGVDVGAKADMHELIRAASTEAAVLLCSTDLDELVSICDRVLVFRRGRVAAELSGPDLNRYRLLTEMNGPG